MWFLPRNKSTVKSSWPDALSVAQLLKPAASVSASDWHLAVMCSPTGCITRHISNYGNADGLMVWGILYWQTCSISNNRQGLNATAYLSIAADHVHPCMTSMYPSCDCWFHKIICHVSKLRSAHSSKYFYSEGFFHFPLTVATVSLN